MNTNAPLLAVFAILATLIGSIRLWWLSAPVNETRYFWDYCRFTLGIPSVPVWPYRIETVQHLPITVLPDAVYDGRTLWQVLLWPLIATAAVGLVSFVLAAVFSPGPRQEKVLRGPRLVSAWQFNLRTLFKRKGAFYIETK